ncbi:hypothetical protein FRB96_008283 [Tulasnella sp. 330]|nr:hypothetical protein FRB96_008283 [Tulasnella sp. 330]KAG8886151.1 hypothetical protein FRB97_007189 [Tulasnella sp. 331]KAG8890446.1 hypothetical protein FRB98_008481 [Tulasnella sp. 332]
MLKLWRGASSSNQPIVKELMSTSLAPSGEQLDIAVATDKDKDDQKKDMVSDTTSAIVESEGGASSDVVQSVVEPATEPVVEATNNISSVEGDQVPFSTAAAKNSPTAETGGHTTEPNHTVSEGTQTAVTSPLERVRRLSLRSFAFFYGRSTPNLVTTIEDGSEEHGSTANPSAPVQQEPRLDTPAAAIVTPIHQQQLKKPKHPTRAEKRTASYALLLRSIIIGTPYSSTGRSKPPPIKKLKSELLNAKDANRLIAQVRELPTPDTSRGVLHGTLRGLNGKLEEKDFAMVPNGRTPIHAACLDCTDIEADEAHFSRLTSASGGVVEGTTTLLTLTPEVAQTGPSTLAPPGSPSSGGRSFPNIAQADLSSIIPVLQTLRLVDLVSQSIEFIGTPSNDFGFGESVEHGGGFLAGAVPSSGSLAEGVITVGQQLLSLGFATSAAVIPSHVGVYPPKDRLSVLSYWWGYEVVIPPPSMKYLANCKSIQNAVLNFLTAFALFNNGVRELLPFVRYASQFIDFEWGAIKAQDKGKGVVCAATWVMPAALVPRPWDFSDPPLAAKPKPKVKVQLTSLSPGPDALPGTQVIVPPQPEEPDSEVSISRHPSSSSIPMVTLSPPTFLDAVVATESD